MRTITVTEKHKAVNEGRMSKSEFVRQMRQSYPMYISPQNGYDATVQILKNKQMLFEEKEYEVDDTFKYSDDSLRRAIDIELEAMGLMSHGTISMEDQVKAKKKAIANLKKDPLHYYHLISGDSSKVNKHDKPVEVKKGNEVDTFNGMKKAELKENVEKELGASDGEISDLVKNEKHIKDKLDKAGKKYSKSYDKDKHGQKIVVFKLKEEVSEADPIPTEPGIPGQRASNHNRKMALRKVIDTLTKDGHPEKGYKVSSVEAVRFIRTYKDEIFNGTIDFNNAEAIWDEYEESESIDRDSVDEQEVEEQMTDQQMKDIQNYGKADKIIKPFKPGDTWSDDFDYEGMLEAGLKVRLNTPLETMEALYGSFEDVNYHSENKHLGAAIDAKKEGDKSEALDHLRNFRKAVKETLLNLNEGGNPLRDVEEVMGYNRRGEKEEEPRPSNYTKVSEKKGKDHDGDGDIDSDDYMAAKDKAIKKAMGKEVDELKEYSDDDDEQEWREEFPNAIKYSWEWDDEGVGAVDSYIDDLFSRGAPEISKEEAMEMMGRPDDETAKAFNQAFITQMQETDDTGGTEMDYQYTINLLYAYEKTYGEPFNTKLIKFLSPYKDAKPKTYDEYKRHISKLLGKDLNESVVKNNIKSIITKILEEEVINEAATNDLAKIAEDYGDFEGLKPAIIALQNIVTEIESFYDKTRGKIQKIYNDLGEVRNEEGLKVGAFIAPSIENAFKRDLRPITKQQFHGGLEMPKVKRISESDPVMRKPDVTQMEAPKETVFTPVNEKKNKNGK